MNLPKVPISQFFLFVLKFVVPFLVWMFAFRDFIGGRIPLNMDSITIYSVTKYYFNNLLNGVVPLWDPFVLLGTPFYAITLCNLFNPVILLVPLLKILGVDYYPAFMVYMLCYFFLGALGFYCLAKVLVKDRRAAYLGYIWLLCSGIGASMFNQLTIVELFVPAVWFFVFLLRFADGFKPGDFGGLVISAMAVAIAYLPFYFATLMLFVVLLVLVFDRAGLLRFVRGSIAFVRARPLRAAVGAAGLLIALSPLVVYKMIDAGRDVVSPARHCNYATTEECYNRTLDEQGGMSYAETSQGGGLAQRLDVRSLWTHLDKISYGIDQFFYIPGIVLIILCLSAFVPLERTQWTLALAALGLTLVGLGDVTPVHRFLYDHLFYFKYFRNLFFVQAYIIPIVILFAVGLLKDFLNRPDPGSTGCKALVVWTVLVHLALGMYLSLVDGTLPATLGTVALSAIVFVAFQLMPGRGRWILPAGLLAVSVLQPLAVFGHYSRNAVPFQCAIPGGHARPQFAWTRPTEEVQSGCKIFKFVHYESFYESMAMKDARGYIGFPTSVTRGAFVLSQWIDGNILRDYASRKFWLYDRAVGFDEKALEVRSLGDVLQARRNAAYVHPKEGSPEAVFGPQDWAEGPAQVLDGSAARVKHFDVNNLIVQLNLPQKKFLVYTDGFTRNWKVLVNGKTQTLYRAQAAFKGVWVPAGESSVEFRYDPPGGGWIYLLVTAALCGFWGAALMSFYRENNWPWQTTRY